MSKLLRFTVVACLLAVAFGSLAPRPQPASAQGPNLLTDGDFESPAPWPMQDGIGEVQVAPGWRAWYLTSPPSYVQVPANCNDAPNRTDCYWMRPEFRDNISASFANRVHGGIRSQKYFSFGRMHEAGLYQRVTGVAPGMVLRFSIYTQAWMCDEPDNCGKYGEHSDAPSNMHLRVGIDPYGGTDPFSSNIVWTGEMDAFDRWVEFAVQATAQANAVTVFTHSRPDWDWARKDNDVYLDDASLVQVGGPGRPVVQPTNTPDTAPVATSTTAPAATPTEGTPPPTSTPYLTPTAWPDGSLIHIIQPGDTVDSVAQQYQISVDELYRLNNIADAPYLYIGESLVIKAGQANAASTQTPPAPNKTPTATLQLTGSPVATATRPSTATPTLQPAGGLCLSAFEDSNNNGLRDGGETGLSGVQFAIVPSAQSELEAKHTSDNSLSPHCLTNLALGSYTVRVTAPEGYTIAFNEIEVTLVEGQSIDLRVAARRSEKASPAPAVTSRPEPTRAVVDQAGAAGLTPGIIGLGILVVLVGVGVVVMRRQRS